MKHPLQFFITGTLRLLDGVLCLDAGESGSVPLVKGDGVPMLIKANNLPSDIELGGERALVVVTVPGVEVDT